MPDYQIHPSLKWASLTSAVNEMRVVSPFLRNLLYSRVQPLATEDVELSVYSSNREIAAFVRKNGEGIITTGHSETFQTVQAPNIRIKRPFTPSDLLYTRRPGTSVFPSVQQHRQAIQDHINRDLAVMENQVVAAEEWLCAQTLTGQITYEVADQEVFEITFPRSNTHDTALTSTTAWDAYSGTGPDEDVNPLQNVHAMKRILSNSTGVAPTDAICGRNAANALLNMAENDGYPALKTDSGISAGTMTFVEQFRDSGAYFLGTLGGVRFWEYDRSALNPQTGTQTKFIRDDYVEFVSANSGPGGADRVMYYGSIPDMDALGNNSFIGRRFSKSWIQPDPSTMMILLASRPLPVPRRPDAMISLKVTNI
jgi:hypothetical protein